MTEEEILEEISKSLLSEVDKDERQLAALLTLEIQNQQFLETEL